MTDKKVSRKPENNGTSNMCLCCDIMSKRISLLTARKIKDKPKLRYIYDELREYDVSLEEILKTFNENDWDECKIADIIAPRMDSLKARYCKKNEIKDSSDDFTCE